MFMPQRSYVPPLAPFLVSMMLEVGALKSSTLTTMSNSRPISMKWLFGFKIFLPLLPVDIVAKTRLFLVAFALLCPFQSQRQIFFLWGCRETWNRELRWFGERPITNTVEPPKWLNDSLLMPITRVPWFPYLVSTVLISPVRSVRLIWSSSTYCQGCWRNCQEVLCRRHDPSVEAHSVGCELRWWADNTPSVPSIPAPSFPPERTCLKLRG